MFASVVLHSTASLFAEQRRYAPSTWQQMDLVHAIQGTVLHRKLELQDATPTPINHDMSRVIGSEI